MRKPKKVMLLIYGPTGTEIHHRTEPPSPTGQRQFKHWDTQNCRYIHSPADDVIPDSWEGEIHIDRWWSGRNGLRFLGRIVDHPDARFHNASIVCLGYQILTHIMKNGWTPTGLLKGKFRWNTNGGQVNLEFQE